MRIIKIVIKNNPKRNILIKLIEFVFSQKFNFLIYKKIVFHNKIQNKQVTKKVFFKTK